MSGAGMIQTTMQWGKLFKGLLIVLTMAVAFATFCILLVPFLTYLETLDKPGIGVRLLPAAISIVVFVWIGIGFSKGMKMALNANKRTLLEEWREEQNKRMAATRKLK